MYKRINGIQHVGVGVPNQEVSLKWYRKNFGMDINFFSGIAEAPLMEIYTKGEIINKEATMIFNLHGGCAMEVVTPISFEASHAKVNPELGDLGIFSTSIKSVDIKRAFERFTENGINVLGEIKKSPIGSDSFYVKDPNGLLFQISDGSTWFVKPSDKILTGGISGVCIGVSDIDQSMNYTLT